MQSVHTKEGSSDEEEDSSVEQQNDQKVNDFNNGAPIFGDQPVSMRCPFCMQHINSQVIAKPQFVSIALGLLLFSIFPNAIMIIIVLIVMQITATRKHRCPLCERQLGSDGKFLKVFDDEVYSFSLTDSGVLISKKIIFTGVLILLVFSVTFVRAAYLSQPTVFTDITWPQLKQLCPKNTISVYCKEKIEDKTVKNWKGYIMKVNDQRSNFRKYYEHAVGLFLKMDPAENGFEQPDLILTANSADAYHLAEIFDELSHGDQIQFNGTFIFTKKQDQVDMTRHLHVMGLKKTGVHDPHVHLYLTQQEKKILSKTKLNQDGTKSLRTHQQEEKPELKEIQNKDSSAQKPKQADNN